MPLNTSDIHKTICMEMRMAKAMNILNLCHGGTTKSSSFVTPPEHIGPNKFTFPSIDAAVVRNIPTANPREMKNSSLNNKHSVSAVAVTSNNGNKDNFSQNSNYTVHNSTNADLASVDSSDTFMSCQTHPFLSQGDLAMVDDDNHCDLDLIDADANFYINSAKNAAMLMRGSSLHSGPVNIIVDSSLSAPQVKKSTSGDTALRSLATSPIEEQYQAFVGERGSRVSLNETPVPKHRKTRFQQQHMATTNKSNDETSLMVAVETTVNSNNGGGLASNKKNRRASFMPSKIITNATKQLINQHLFGLQTMGSSKGKRKLFLLIHDELLSIIIPSKLTDGSSDTHKRSKSILKNKSDARLASDPESERLLSDTGSGVSDISVIPVS